MKRFPKTEKNKKTDENETGEQWKKCVLEHFSLTVEPFRVQCKVLVVVKKSTPQTPPGGYGQNPALEPVVAPGADFTVKNQCFWSKHTFRLDRMPTCAKNQRFVSTECSLWWLAVAGGCWRCVRVWIPQDDPRMTPG